MRRISELFLSTAAVALAAGAFLASTDAHAQLLSSTAAGGIETVVVTGTAFDPENAPAKARLETMQPQTIIGKSYIEDSVSETADFTTILAIAPGLTGFDTNGPGFSDNGVKNTMRGLPDGSYGMSYDGIPFGDTNGPSHHSQSYFPGSTIGSIEVDRGPGNAGSMGASTYGGSINMFSEVLTSNARGKVSATGGSWGIAQTVGNYQTGDFTIGGINNRAMINLQYSTSDGYLTGQSSAAKNITIKTQTELAPGWNLTLFS
ncbi:MAG: TonB-dependent receptor plug domain-containing protein, partial [Alphaproteobacteria bacterium]|nr:TonB-dependent receptor plug domain-containing protein [Alphaproteobacteria bacterium]